MACNHIPLCVGLSQPFSIRLGATCIASLLSPQDNLEVSIQEVDFVSVEPAIRDGLAQIEKLGKEGVGVVRRHEAGPVELSGLEGLELVPGRGLPEIVPPRRQRMVRVVSHEWSGEDAMAVNCVAPGYVCVRAKVHQEAHTSNHT